MRNKDRFFQKEEIEMVFVHMGKDRVVRVPYDLLTRNMRDTSDIAEAWEKNPGEPITHDRYYHRMSFDKAAVAHTINQTIGPKIRIPLKLR